MTLIVGILCSDGVVMASDSAATYSTGFIQTIGQQEVTKVRKLGDAVLFSSTGAIGISQMLAEAVERLWKAKKFTDSSPADAMLKISEEVRKSVGNVLQTTVQASGGFQSVTQVPGILQLTAALVPIIGQQAAGVSALTKIMVALPLKKKPCLFQFDYSGAPEEATSQLPFVALGVGQPIADPFLAFLKRILWKDRQATVAEGRFAAAWTVKHVSETIPGGVGGKLQMASLMMKGSDPLIEFAETGEHQEAIQSAEGALRDHILNQGKILDEPKGSGIVPEPPKLKP